VPRIPGFSPGVAVREGHTPPARRSGEAAFCFREVVA
jgi:hypothetical protein